jgi:hypothetical protein
LGCIFQRKRKEDINIPDTRDWNYLKLVADRETELGTTGIKAVGQEIMGAELYMATKTVHF